MNTHSLRSALLCAALLLTAGCAGSLPANEVQQASAATLANTHWRLTQLGNEVIDNPPGGREIFFQLQASSTNVTGHSGCNRMFGRYALEGTSLKFDAMGGTRMACDNRMELEQKFLTMFSQVAGWRIAQNTLELLDGEGKPVATFEAQAATG